MARPKPALTQADLLRARCRRALSAHRRRARREGRAVPYGVADLEALLRAAPVCGYCRAPVPPDYLTFDHETPTARGGGWGLDNLRVACRNCNVEKGALTVSEFLNLRELLKSFHPAGEEDVRRRLRSGGRVYATHRKR